MAKGSGARGGLTSSSFNTKGPTPGSTKAISQRKAISDGYDAVSGPRTVKTNQTQVKTGVMSAPGLTTRGKR